MLEDLLDSASVGGRRAMTALQKAAEFFDGDDDRGILLEGLVGIAAGLVDAINGVTVPDESCGPRCNCGSCDDTGSEHGLKTCTIHWCSEDAEVVCTHCHEAFCEAHVSGILCIECDADTTDSVGGDDA